MLPFQIKICGITTLEDAQVAQDVGADAIGLNFVASSPRYVSPADAALITPQLAPDLQKVGVFVNATSAEILQIVQQVGLTAVQLHGDEPPAQVQELRAILPAGMPLIKAFRLSSPHLQTVCDYLQECEAIGQMPDFVLVDAYAPDAYGGTGQKLDWNVLGDQRQTVPLPIVLAGGLVPENVAEAIAMSGCLAVDTASGVEQSPGKKDLFKVSTFVSEAKRAFGPTS